jgi:adenylate cyclase
VRTPFGFRSFQARILVFFLGLLVIVQAAVFLAVNTAGIRSSRTQIREALEVTASVFERLVKEREVRLLEAARLLSSDYAFKQAYATRDRATILSAIENHRDRIRADAMMVVSSGNLVIADTLHPERGAAPVEFPGLIDAASRSEYGEAASVVFIDGRPYQMVVVPLLIPLPDAWICIGFFIDDRFVAELQRLTQSHVSLLGTRQGEAVAVLASTLPPGLRDELPGAARADEPPVRETALLRLGGSEFVSLAVPLVEEGGTRVLALLQRSFDEALGPYRRLRLVLAALFAAGLAMSIAGATFMARTVTRPVRALVAGVRRIGEGDYTGEVTVKQRDEIGKLADGFNRMQRGLAERDRVRSLLGKVVSPAIAEELMKKDIELGGEERVVTILFSDLRDFTSLCERRSAREILSLLNAYFTRVSSVIEANGGVVDKYIGDAIMALYGAPLERGDDAGRAVRTAVGMCEALSELNGEFERAGLPRLELGVGINTALVVAGNMGSLTRLNYTVVGDGVNLASRIEGLSKRYGVSVVVSEATRSLVRGFVFRELDRVRVKGRAEPVVIYEPVAESMAADARMLAELDAYAAALARYRERQWDEALSIFRRLESERPGCRLYRIYVERTEGLLREGPGPDWDGTFAFSEK